jgi:hypothetical protein
MNTSTNPEDMKPQIEGNELQKEETALQKEEAELQQMYEEQLEAALSHITETKEVKFGDETVVCKVINPDNLQLLPDGIFDLSPNYVKNYAFARQSTTVEDVSPTQDGELTYQAQPGDWIMKNPSDDSEYLFGDPTSSTVEERQAKFSSLYEADPSNPGRFKSVKPPFKAVKLPIAVTYEKWGSWDSKKAGDVITRQHDGERYGIDMESFEADYRVENID